MIHETAVIYPNVIIGENVYIGPNCIIGSPAESKEYWGKDLYTVIIYDNCIINGNVTIDAGTVRNTIIKQGSFIMKGVHIGHDCIINEFATLSPHVCVGGHSTIGAYTNMGMGSIVHQRVNVPDKCMIGMGCIVTKKTDLKAQSCYVGNPARYLRPNIR